MRVHPLVGRVLLTKGSMKAGICASSASVLAVLYCDLKLKEDDGLKAEIETGALETVLLDLGEAVGTRVEPAVGTKGETDSSSFWF